MDPRLLAIVTPTIRAEASELVRLALNTLHSRTVDDALYERFVASRTNPEEAAPREASLREIWRQTFATLEALLAYCRQLSHSAPAAPGDAGGGDFDFSDFEAPAKAEPEEQLALGSDDIGDLVAHFGDQPVGGTEPQRWAHALEQIASVHYGLQANYGDACRRMDVALLAGQPGHVLGLLDDTTNSANEGVHALVTAVYAEFVPNAAPESLVPGYLSALMRALMVRRGIAALVARLTPLNDVLQGPDRAQHAAALEAVRAELHAFVQSEVWRAMRAADRWEAAQFDRLLHEEEFRGGRLASEGLVKYLESLGSINQREVLVQHDKRVLDELQETITTAEELMGVSQKTTHQMLLKACRLSLELRGRRPPLDALLEQVAALHLDTSRPTQNADLLQWLQAVVAAAG